LRIYVRRERQFSEGIRQRYPEAKPHIEIERGERERERERENS